MLNVGCAIGSLTMNLLAADLNSPRSITVWVMPSALYALASDRLIAVVRRWVLSSDADAEVTQQASPWQALGGAALWLVRQKFDLPGTIAGFRRWVLVMAPVVPGTRALLPVSGRPLTLPAGVRSLSPRTPLKTTKMNGLTRRRSSRNSRRSPAASLLTTPPPAPASCPARRSATP